MQSLKWLLLKRGDPSGNMSCWMRHLPKPSLMPHLPPYLLHEGRQPLPFRLSTPLPTQHHLSNLLDLPLRLLYLQHDHYLSIMQRYDGLSSAQHN
jgi:hypothetical protein